MKPVYQTIVDLTKGNCLQASIASLLSIGLGDVPNFIAESELTWYCSMHTFLRKRGYDLKGFERDVSSLKDAPAVGGCVCAMVPSKTFEDAKHAVLVNPKGLVVHDPNPNKLWLGINVLESGDLEGFDIIEKAV